MNDDCIFCKVSAGEISSYKIYEDEEFIAILDLYPNTNGMVLVLTREHYDSYTAEMDDEIYSRFFLAAKKISKLIDQKLGVERTALVMEGMGINHAHIKLYPLHGLDVKFKEMHAGKNVFFDKYQGYITTQMGPKASDSELNKVLEIFK
ncbi:MAG: HIT domain-containing protein [Ignavibacteria bacterium]